MKVDSQGKENPSLLPISAYNAKPITIFKNSLYHSSRENAEQELITDL